MKRQRRIINNADQRLAAVDQTTAMFSGQLLKRIDKTSQRLTRVAFHPIYLYTAHGDHARGNS
jgi:hypothetical protein